MDIRRFRLLRLQEVLKVCGISKALVYDKIRQGTFPKPLRVGSRGARWREDEIRAWIESLPLASEENLD